MSGIETAIEAMGGTGSAATVLGVHPSTVSSWKARGSIPAEHWSAIVREAGKRGRRDVNFEFLAGLHARPDATAGAR